MDKANEVLMPKTKVVLDTNVWITYFLQGGASQLLRLQKQSSLVIFRSNALDSEIEAVVQRRKIRSRLPLPAETYLMYYSLLTTNFDTKPVFTACRDTKDNYLFDLAIQAQADYLVSGDKQVLATPVAPPLQLLTLAEFNQLLAAIG